MSNVERIFSVSVFPLAMIVSVGVMLQLITSESDIQLGTGLVILGVALTVMVLEHVFPYHRSWLKSRGDIGPDIAYALGVQQGVTILVVPVVAYLGLGALEWLGGVGGADLWPSEWQYLAQLPLALVVAELPKYWHHRLQHSIDFLWRFHATHHSAPRLYFLNAARFHPIDIFIDGILGGVTLVALGCGIEVISLFAVVSGVHGLFQHANLKLRLGPLNYFFSMAEPHRWHHSPNMAEANHNYGQNVIVWDLVFGTFYLPADREPPEDIGIPDLAAFPTKFWRQMASPFTWARIKRESAAG